MNSNKIAKVITTAIDSGSLTAAGEILGYTQSNLTQMVRAFEDEIGFPVLIKTKKGVEPTEECKLLLPSMRALLNQEDVFLQEIHEISGIQKGSIRIGTFVSTSTTWLPSVISHFQANYPDISFEIEESGQDEMERGLIDGTLDIALLSRPEHSSIDFIPLLDDPLLVVFSDKHDLGSYDFVPVQELKKHPLILTYQSYDRDVRRVFDDAGFSPEVKYYFKDDFAVLSMVQQGIGVSVLPELIVEKFPGDYDARMLEPEAYRTLGIGVRSLQAAGPLANLVISYLKESVR